MSFTRFFAISSLTFFSSVLLPSPSLEATPISHWDLPMNITDGNTEIKFEVDTTWHVVYGKVSGVTGDVALKNPQDIGSVSGEIRMPVKKFTTGWDARDQSLHDHMQAETFPEVVLKINQLKTPCAPSDQPDYTCKTTLLSTLRICDVSKDIEVDATIKKTGEQYEVVGSHPIKWAEYHVQDPSMVVAKVDPTVKISFTVKLSASK